MEKIWTRDDSVDSEIKHNSKYVIDFITRRFSNIDEFDFKEKNSFYFAVILCERFSLDMIWDELHEVFYAGKLGENKAILYNINGMEVIDKDWFWHRALTVFDYDDEALYERLDKKYIN